MHAEMLKNLGLTEEKLVMAVASQIVESMDIYDLVAGKVNAMVREKIERAVGDTVEQSLSAEMEKILSEEICPVNIWGEPTSDKTTIRAELAKRAHKYWETKVDDNGKIARYGGKTRAQRMIEQTATSTFQDAIKQNTATIVDQFKKALKAESATWVENHIDSLFPKSRK